MTDPTALNLDAITAKGWAAPADFTPEELTRATAFYESMRSHDGDLLQIRAEASALIEQWTSRTPRDVGSFGIRLNLETSDLDLGIAYPVDRRDQLMDTSM